MTFADLEGLEPELSCLISLARSAPVATEEEAIDFFCRDLKPRLVGVVGWDRTYPGVDILFTRAAYELAYHTLLRAVGP